jgi:hypothetical protein
VDGFLHLSPGGHDAAPTIFAEGENGRAAEQVNRRAGEKAKASETDGASEYVTICSAAVSWSTVQRPEALRPFDKLRDFVTLRAASTVERLGVVGAAEPASWRASSCLLWFKPVVGGAPRTINQAGSRLEWPHPEGFRVILSLRWLRAGRIGAPVFEDDGRLNGRAFSADDWNILLCCCAGCNDAPAGLAYRQAGWRV